MSIEKLRRGWNDATRARAAAASRAGAWAWAWAWAWRDEDPPGSWLTREPLYKALSGHPLVVTNNTLLHTDIPIPWLARTGPWESRSLRDVRRIQSSPARVKTGDHVFGECYQHDYSVLLLPVHGSTRYCS
jgi:hypothetical protein